MKTTSDLTYFFALVTIGILFQLVISCSTSKTSKVVPPNVIVIMADDLGYETIAANGGISYQTPQLDKMASEGVRFEQCYAQPLCTPSRIQIMTGIYNVRNYVEFGLLDTSQTTFAHLYQEAGYATCIVGKWQLGKDPKSPNRAGFDEYCLWQVSQGARYDNGNDTRFSAPELEINGDIRTYGRTEYGPDIVSDYGLEFIERAVEKEKPFLLYYPMILTHCPFSPTPDSEEWLTDSTTIEAYKGNAKYFGDMMSYTDKIVGKINQHLEDLGVADNTLVLFVGDNGTDKPVVSEMQNRTVAGAKNTTTDAGTHVPLIVKWPAQIISKQRSKDLIDLTDVLPTICEASNIEVPTHLQIDGVSFLAQLKGEQGNPRDWVYSWYSRSGKTEKAQVFARDQRYKLYSTGAFYDVINDYDEERPIALLDLDEDIKKKHHMLQKVIENYAAQRYNKLPHISN
ncbi:MAG: arylsulfatase A [Saprospiraceae bacterium]|jgi:arylsulfatase A